MTRFAIVLAACGCATGCGALLGIDDLVADRVDPAAAGGAGGGAAGGSGAAASGCADVCGTPGCGDCPAAELIDVPHGRSPYRIDRYEVTNAEYKAFLDVGVAPGGPGPECAHNSSYEPGVVSQEVLDAVTAAGLPLTVDDRPIACVDVCDARAYCAWAGQRLCGEVGGDILDVTQGEAEGRHVDPDRSEWYRACSNAGATLFPYGDTYEGGTCIDASLSPNVMYEGGYARDCIGGYPDLYDMSGNAGEWENACTSFGGHPATQNCLVRGGAYFDGGDGSALTCDVFKDTMSAGVSDTTGFRCCDD